MINYNVNHTCRQMSLGLPPNIYNCSFYNNNEIEEINRKHQRNMEKIKLKHRLDLEKINKERNEGLYQNQKYYEYHMNRIQKSKSPNNSYTQHQYLFQNQYQFPNYNLHNIDNNIE